MKITNLSELYDLHFPEKSENTLASYRKSWNNYKNFMKEKFNITTDEKAIEETNWSSAQLFKNELIKKGLNPKTVNNQLSGLRSYFNFLINSQVVQDNPFVKIEGASTKCVDYERPYLVQDEFETLLNTIMTKEKGRKQDCFELTSHRDLLAVGILLTCGLRISELLNIKVGDIKENGSLEVLGKGKKLRRVVIGSKNLQRLAEYLEIREQYVMEDCDYLFISKYGKRPSPQSFNKNLKKYLDRADLDTSVSAHGLRASSATNYLREGVRPTQIAKLLGHSDVKTTLKHYAKEDDNFDFIQ